MLLKPYIIWIDGMQHTGKWELIKALVVYFREQGYNVLVMKGAWSRAGKWSTETLYDPVDARRQATTPRLYSQSLSDSLWLWEQATVKLQTELQAELQALLLQKDQVTDIIILDRTMLTPNFLRRIKNPTETMAETARYYQETYNISLHLPHACIVFYAENQQILENRVNKKSAWAKLKLDSISYNWLFNTCIYDTPPEIKKRTLLINTDNTLKNIQTLVIQALEKEHWPIRLPLQNEQKKL